MRKRPLRVCRVLGLAALLVVVAVQHVGAEDAKPAAPPSVDLDLIVAQLEPLVGDPAFGPIPGRSSAELVESLQQQRDGVPADVHASYSRAVVEGREGAAIAGGPNSSMVHWQLFRFDGPAAAQSFVDAERVVSQLDDKPRDEGTRRYATTRYEEGTGPDGKFPGFASTKRFARTSGTACEEVARFESIVVSLWSSVADVDRAALDDALVRVQSATRDPEAARKAPTAQPVPLKSFGRLVRIVVHGADGSRVTRARVNVAFTWDDFGDNQSARPSGDGAFLARVPRVPCTIDVHAARAADGKPLEWGPASTEAGPDVDAVELTMPKGVAIAGVVVGADGKPAPDVEIAASVMALGPPGVPKAALPPGGLPVHSTTHGTAKSGPDGVLRIAGLAATHYRLAPVDETEWFTSKTIEADGGAEGVRVVVERTVAADVTVVDADGKPVPRASVIVAEVIREKSHFGWHGVATLATDGLGVAHVKGLRAGVRYQLSASPPKESTDLADAGVDSWAPVATTLRLDRARTIEGTVRDPDGPTAAEVRWKASDGRSGSRKSNSDGGFRLERVPRVDVVVTATKRGDGVPSEIWTTTVTVGAEQGHVDLLLAKGPVLAAPIPPSVLLPPGVSRVLLRIDGVAPLDRVTFVCDDAATSPYVTAPGVVAVPRDLVGKTCTVWVAPRDGKGLFATSVKLAEPIAPLALVPLQTISGRLKADGLRFPESAAIGPGRVTVVGAVEEDGTFTVDVPPGHYTLRAKGKTEAGWVYGSVEVDAGAKDVEVPLRPR